jgi:peptidyl-prolyl cis-trans isomerase A (cyclophilin A)
MNRDSNQIRRLTVLALSLIAVTASCAAAGAQKRGADAQKRAADAGLVHIRIETESGVILADLDSARAPGTVTNFLRYVDAGLYRDGTFYRTVRADNQPRDSVRIAVIQGGRRSDRDIRSFPPIALERTSVTGLLHRDGTLSMARGASPNSATEAFFICIGDQPSLDFGGHRNLDGQGFAAFGRVTKGMDVVRRINVAPAGADQKLQPPIRILNITRSP